jgi:hypothetical protein
MPKTPSNVRLLQIVTQSVKEARRLIALGDDFSYMRAVFALDFAVEQMLNVLIDNFATETNFGRDDVNWQTLWQTATTAVKDANVIHDRIPHYRELKKLHDIRNLAQHGGCTPHSSDITQLVEPVVRMISTCFDKGFGLSFENFRLWDVIQNSRLRELLTQCDQALEDGSPLYALIGAISAYHEVRSEIETEIPSLTRPPTPTSSGSLTGGRVDPWWEGEYRKFSEWITGTINGLRQLHIDSIFASLGLPMVETQKFRKLTEEIRVGKNLAKEWIVRQRIGRSDEDLKERANFALGYLSTLVLRAQEVYPEALARVSFKMLLNDWIQANDLKS